MKNLPEIKLPLHTGYESVAPTIWDVRDANNVKWAIANEKAAVLFADAVNALSEIAETSQHLDDEQFTETHGEIALFMRRLARQVFAKTGMQS